MCNVAERAVPRFKCIGHFQSKHLQNIVYKCCFNTVPPAQTKDGINQVTLRLKVKEALQVIVFIKNTTPLSFIYNPYCHRKNWHRVAINKVKFRVTLNKGDKEPQTED